MGSLPRPVLVAINSVQRLQRVHVTFSRGNGHAGDGTSQLELPE